MAESFYVTLPSNACHDIFPDNNSTNFTITLSQPIELQGSYEVALAEIMYCNTWNNIETSENGFEIIDHSNLKDPPLYLKIATGSYESIELIVREMNAVLKSSRIDLMLYYSSINKRISILGTDRYSIKLSARLCYILGFEDGVWVRMSGKTKAKYPCDINGGQYNFYVYTNIVEAQHVGDYTVPLLRIVKKEGSYGDVIILSYTHPHYITVNKQRIQDIQLELKTDLNTPVRFTYGKTICKLHFRPVSKSFL